MKKISSSSNKSFWDKIIEPEVQSIAQNKSSHPTLIKVIRFSFDENLKNPKHIGFQFRSLSVINSYNENSIIYFKPNSTDGNNDYLPLKANSVLKFNRNISSAEFNWDFSPGDYVEVAFFFDAVYENGKSVVQGDVTILDSVEVYGEVFTTRRYPSVITDGLIDIAGLGITLIWDPPDNTTREVRLYNETVYTLRYGGDTINSDSNVGTGIGMPFPVPPRNGEYISIMTSAKVYVAIIDPGAPIFGSNYVRFQVYSQ